MTCSAQPFLEVWQTVYAVDEEKEKKKEKGAETFHHPTLNADLFCRA